MSRQAVALVLGFAVALGLALALAPPADAAEPRVAILEPGPFEPVSGSVEVVVEVRADEPVVQVDLFVDGRLAGQLGRPPWRWRVELSNDNREHLFRAVARTASGAVGTMEIQTPAIQVDETLDLALRQLYVTLSRGTGGRPLGRDDFLVLDDGVRQEIVTFEGGDAPLTAVLLVDSSSSMRGARLEAALEGVDAFVAGMRELDEAKVMLFSDRLSAATRFTGDAGALSAVLAGARAEGGTALADHLYAALKLLDGYQGRRVVVVLSDGQDVYSALGMEDVLWKARRGQAAVYWLALRDRGVSDRTSYSSAWRDVEGNRTELETLRTVVAESGGRVVEVDSPAAIPGAFAEILQELRGQYVIGYYPSNATGDGRWHTIEVRARRGGRVRVREGYVDH